MQKDPLEDAIVMEGVSNAGRQSGEEAANIFRSVDTTGHMPHVAHTKPAPDEQPDEFAYADTILQLHPTRDLDESFEQGRTADQPAQRARMSLLDGTSPI